MNKLTGIQKQIIMMNIIAIFFMIAAYFKIEPFLTLAGGITIIVFGTTLAMFIMKGWRKVLFEKLKRK